MNLPDRTGVDRSARQRSVSLARQFAGTAAALAGISVLLVALCSWWWIDRLQHASSLALQQRDVELRAVQVGESLSRVDERARELASSPLLSTALTDSAGRDAYLRPFLGGIQTINDVPLELLLVDFEGKEIARNGDLSFTAAQRRILQDALARGVSIAEIVTEEQRSSLLLSTVIRYPRTQTVEGAVWIKLPLARLLQSDGYTLHLGAKAGQVPEGYLRAAVALPASMAPLALTVEQEVRPLPHLGALPYGAGLALGALALVVAVGLIGRRLAGRLTADLAALDRFANSVAERVAGSERTVVQGSAEVVGLASSINHMLERLQAQHETLQDEARSQLHLLATCIAHLNDVVMITEPDPDHPEGHRIVFVNEAFTRVTGYTIAEVIGRGPKLLQGAETDATVLRRVGDSLRKWQPVRAEVLNYSKSGEPYWIEMEIVPVKDPSGAVTHWVSVERDVTARRASEETRRSLEQQVRESQKMEAIGTLAGGIAHDFNNILGAILGSVTLARGDLARGQPVGERIEQIGRSASRARSLVQQILTYSRRQQQLRIAQDLRSLVDEAAQLLRATVPASVELHCQLPAQPVIVEVDATELTQVLMNLGTNAWQALHDGAGQVVMGLEIEHGATGRAAAVTDDVTRAHLWVSDTGCGMTPATVSHIFEPFFTTKPVGEGTGLGLSVVQGIVRSHGGVIHVDSQLGIGTTFHIRLPLAQQAGADASASNPFVDARSMPMGRGERVLYLDDDEVMRTVASALLQSWGYEVTAVQSALQALTVVRAEPREFDLVITDFNMPGMSGIEMLRELRQIKPRLPVILTSGFINETMREQALGAGARGVIRKENLHEELAAAVSSILAPAQD